MQHSRPCQGELSTAQNRVIAARRWRAGCNAERGNIAIDNASHRSILTASIPSYERRGPTYEPPCNRAFYERNSMSDSNAQSHEQRIAGVVERLLNEHSINRVAGTEEDLRQAGLSSLDMVSLVLLVEEEFGV